MERKLFGLFSGRQLTAIAITAILAPSALFAAVTYTAVGIIDPNSGTKSYVDPTRKLWVFDPVGGYAATPANLVDIGLTMSQLGCQDTGYKVPAGKALVLRSISGFVGTGTASVNSSIFFTRDAGCSINITAFGLTPKVAGELASFDISLGSGATLPAGAHLYLQPFNANTLAFHLHGYLVPANTVPAAGSAEAAELQGPKVSGEKATYSRR